MKSTSNWMVAKPTGATTTNTAPSLASFFTPTEYESVREKEWERKRCSERKREAKEGAFIIQTLYFIRISPLLQHTFSLKETQWNEGPVAFLRITLLIDQRQGNTVIKVMKFFSGKGIFAFLVLRLQEWLAEIFKLIIMCFSSVKLSLPTDI